MGIKKITNSISAMLLIGCFVFGCNQSMNEFTLYNKNKIMAATSVLTDGVYYRLIPPDLVSKFQKDTLLDCFVLYKNSSYFTYSAVYKNDIASTLRIAKDHFDEHYKTFKYSPNNWGAFEINADTIHAQYFSTSEIKSSVGERYYIIRDKTSVEKVISSDKETLYDAKELNIFRFFKTNQKPDSTNVFITNKRIRDKLDRLYDKRH
jgi:hypothetical protein